MFCVLCFVFCVLCFCVFVFCVLCLCFCVFVFLCFCVFVFSWRPDGPLKGPTERPQKKARRMGAGTRGRKNDKAREGPEDNETMEGPINS